MEQATARWREASPARYVGRLSPPTLVIGSGEPRFTAGLDEILSALRSHAIRCEFETFEGTPHAFWLFDPYVGQVVEIMDSFLRAEK